MRQETQMLVVRKKRKFSIPKNLNVTRCWNVIGSHVAREIGAPDYTAIPNCFDTNAYKIGHIFVPTRVQITCLRAVPVVKILGPISDFAAKDETDIKRLAEEFQNVRTSGDPMDFRIILESGKNRISFTGRDYCFLSKASDMQVAGNVTINRAAHEDLFGVKWFGLITNVVVAKIIEIHIVKDLHARILYIGDDAHTILFKYEICRVNESGTVINSKVKKIRCKWLPLGDRESDGLPLIKF